jgi:hypothetical protein
MGFRVTSRPLYPLDAVETFPASVANRAPFLDMFSAQPCHFRGVFCDAVSIERYDDWPTGDTIPVFCLEKLTNTTKTVLITIAGVLIEIRTVTIPNTSPDRYRYASLLDVCSISLKSVNNTRATHVTRAIGPLPLLRYPGAR